MSMKNLIRKVVICAALLMLSGVVFAENPSKADVAMRELVKKYEDTKGVECVTVAKGSGLEVMKIALNKQMGISFMKGVTSITIISYDEASAEVAESLRKDLDVFTSLLEEFDMNKDKGKESKSYSRCFACVSEASEGKLSDFVIAIEDTETKMVMYMAGEIIVKDLVEK